MADNYLIYPTSTMNISQSYWDTYSHRKHNTASPADYPIDECCEDSGRSWFYCPCDQMEIIHIYGVGNGGTNTIWMTSTTPVIMPCGIDYVSIMVEHPNDDDLSRLYEGQIFSRGNAMFREGTDGWATGNHFHMSVGKGELSDPNSGWTENGNGAWVIDTTGGALKPQQAFYLLKDNNTIYPEIYEDCGIDFQYLIVNDINDLSGASPENNNENPGSGTTPDPGEEQPEQLLVNYYIINNETGDQISGQVDKNQNQLIYLTDQLAVKTNRKKCVGISVQINGTELFYNLNSVFDPKQVEINGNFFEINTNATLFFYYVYVDKTTNIYFYNNSRWHKIKDIWIYNASEQKWYFVNPYIYNNQKWYSLLEKD